MLEMNDMKSELYINKILKNTGLTRKEIQDMVENKKVELKGLISEEGALFIIARELGVDVKEENKDLLNEIDLNISDITPNMKNINLIGRIKEIYNINKFTKSDGGSGHVGSFLLQDNTGDIRIVLWDDQVNIFSESNFEENELIQIFNGVAKANKFESVEIQVGRFGKLVLSPDDVDYNKYPKIKSKFININEVNLNFKSVSIEGKIIQLTPEREFTRKNGEIGVVRSLNLLDSTGSIRVTFWNDDTAKIKNLKVDDVISISNLNPKLNTLDSKSIDLTVNRSSKLNKLQKKLQIKVELIDNIELLQTFKGITSFKGKITSVDNLKIIESKSGESISLLGFIVSDQTDWIRVTLWGETAEDYSSKLSLNQGLLLKNVIVKHSTFSQRNEISIINDSTLELIEVEVNNPKTKDINNGSIKSSFSGIYRKIDSINTSGMVEIKGYIAKKLENITIYEACTQCFKKLDNCLCEIKAESEFRMIVNLLIDDGSGSIRVTFIGDRAEKFMGFETEKIIQIKETPDFEKFMNKKSSDFLGQDIIIKGKSKFNDYSSSYEILVYEYKYLDIDEELENAMNKIET